MSLLMIIVAVWVVCSVVCINIAKSKGLDTTLWGLLGFFIGPLAILAVAVASPDSRSSQGDADEYKACYSCAELVKLEANRCKHCGADFDPIETSRLIENYNEAAACHNEQYIAARKRQNALFLGIAAISIIGIFLLILIN